MKVPGFAGPTYPAASSKWDSERCINQYPENAVVAGQNAPAALVSRPGLKAWKEVGTGPIRAIHAPRVPGSAGDAIAVSANQVYRITAAAVSTLVGTISSGTTTVSISDNGIDAIIVDGTASGWTDNLTTNVLAAISQPGFYGGTKVDFLNGRFILNKPGTQIFYWSGLYNTTFNALDFASAEGIPDKIQTLAVVNGELWLFGEYSKDVYYNSTDASNPFQRLQGGFSLVGCVSPRSVAVFETVVFWVGWSGQSTLGVYRSEGYQARRISPPAIERLLASRLNNEQLVGYTYSEDSHVFYVLHSVNAADTALVYDMATDQWHERGFTLGLIPAHTWTIRATTINTGSPPSSSWSSVASDGVGFVAVASFSPDSYYAATSPDGIAWTRQSGAFAKAWRGIAWNGTNFAAVTDSPPHTGKAMTSFNGVTWASATTPNLDSQWRAVAWGAGLFVAVADIGSSFRVMASATGSSWSGFPAASANAWQAITFAHDITLFAAVSNTGTGDRVMTSPDGTTWTSRASSADNDWRGIARGNGLFVAVGTDSVMTSPDGTTWTNRACPIGNWRAITWNGTVFAVTANPANNVALNRFMKSEDGINWVVSPSEVSVDGWYGSGIAWNGTNFAAVGDYSGLMSSSDG